ncbi:MAG: hypothetical protein ACRBG0_08255 [Lewinella sp.]|jgi:hypothetical protein|uniref:hypothetical protein n=1 Tax=Lewinella sp. TaxID=2004506 RepID=UPI003D6A1504
MKYSVLFVTLLLSVLSYSLRGQTSTKTQIWVDATTSFGFLDFDPFKLGFGGGVQLSLEKPINTKSSLGLFIGASKMGSYNRVYGEYTYNILPSGFQQREQNTKLQALGFFDTGLRFKHRPQQASPWSWSIGINASLLFQPVGQEYDRYAISVREPEIGENEYVHGFVTSGLISSSSLDAEDFASYDISAEATLYYEITKGCALRASFRQGTKNLINPSVASTGDAQHYLSMLAVGFSARLR